MQRLTLKSIGIRKEEELNDLSEADKLLNFKQKQKRVITQEHRKEFLGLVIDFCQQLEKHFGFLPPKFVALLAMMLADFTKKDQSESYLSEKELSREIQKILRERREEAEGWNGTSTQERLFSAAKMYFQVSKTSAYFAGK